MHIKCKILGTFSLSIVFLITKQGEQHIFLSNHKISTIFKKNGTPDFAIWYIVTTGVSCSFSFLFKSYFIFQKKKKKKKTTKNFDHTIFDHVRKEKQYH